ncbi:ABC transporter ATP-binding protein [Paenalkalicoccus suaedae]|uniref:Carnitine transport ATP-binding protein OpuCA n=1 Tax=Paenalkalicoccus suaedae TaxID=2592382 RepID=A0A859FIG0_9BACI|nr:ABC transporter ATP-binding protein [Paenalkalicoccus suaedae]QKS72921.1 ABC transporter ATP-binding protein [Paenalkalicoccus suaedae]
MLEVTKLSKSFHETPVFKDISFTVSEGELVSLVGPSGCGKTTLLRCLAGLAEASSGDMLLEQQSIKNIKANKRPIVLMFQQALLFPHLTVKQNVTYGLTYGAQKVSKQKRNALADELLQKVELIDLKDRYPNELSGGQQQRVALARALALKPKLLLLDEPFSSLDPSLRTQLRIWLRQFLKAEGVTAIFVTHDKEEAVMMGDKLLVMKDGELKQQGVPEDVYREPNNEHVAGMISDGIYRNETFISAARLSLQKGNIADNTKATTATVLEHYEAAIDYQILAYGYTFYRVTLPSLNQSTVIRAPKHTRFDEGEHVTVFVHESEEQL